MKILMLNPPFLPKFSRGQRSPAVTKSGTLYYPIWLAYATGLLEQAGHEVKLIDAPADDMDLNDCMQLAKDFNPALIVIDTATGSIYNDVEMGTKIKDCVAGSYLALVGTHVTALPQESLEISQEVDCVVRGEYDLTIKELAQTLETGGSLDDVAGITYRNDGSITENDKRDYLQDLDELPFVSDIYARHLDLSKYFNPNADFPTVMVISGRGCQNYCTFCVFPQTLHGHKYRSRSVANVVDEFEFISTKLPQVKSVFFEDDTLTSDKKRCRELSEEILKRGIKLSWSANSRADVDRETLKIMKKAGLKTLCVGFESGDQEILKNIKKGITIRKAKEFVENARAEGVLVHGCFMAGLPGETKETLAKTLAYAKELNPDTAQFYPIMVYPGTEAFKWYDEHNCLNTNNYSEWLTPDGLHNTVIKLPNLTSEEIVKWCDDARREFYLRPGYIFKKAKQMLSDPTEFRRKFKSLKIFYNHLIKGSHKQC